MTVRAIAVPGKVDDSGVRPSQEVVLSVRNLRTWFDTPGGVVKAVDDVSFDIPAGATLGCVGGPGSGKSTLGRLILNLIEADSGSIRLDGAELGGLAPSEMRPHRRDMQIVLQDPLHSRAAKRTGTLADDEDRESALRAAASART